MGNVSIAALRWVWRAMVYALAIGCVALVVLFALLDAWPVGYFGVSVRWSSNMPSHHGHDMPTGGGGSVSAGSPSSGPRE